MKDADGTEQKKGSKIVDDLPDDAHLSPSLSPVALPVPASAMYSELKSNASDLSTSGSSYSCWIGLVELCLLRPRDRSPRLEGGLPCGSWRQPELG